MLGILSKFVRKDKKTSLNGLGRRLKNFHLSQGVLITPTLAIGREEGCP